MANGAAIFGRWKSPAKYVTLEEYIVYFILYGIQKDRNAIKSFFEGTVEEVFCFFVVRLGTFFELIRVISFFFTEILWNETS